MQELIIKIDWLYFLGIMGSLICIAWYSSARFTKSETILSTIDNRLTKSETLLDTIDKRLTNVEGRSSGAFQSHSPISLTEKGNNLLDGSGLREYIDKNKESLSLKCKSNKNLTNAYDVQEAAFDCLDNMFFDEEFESKIKEFAFQQGVDMSVMRRVGGIYFRGILLEQLGMKEKDLDAPLKK